MNQSNCVKSLITQILNTSVQVLKIKWLQRTQESMNNDMLHIHNSSRILIFKFQGMYTQPNAQQSELQKDPDNEDQEGDQKYDRESDEEEACQMFLARCQMHIWGFLQDENENSLFSMHFMKIGCFKFLKKSSK